MVDETWRLRWDSIDKTPDPAWFVRFLDESRRSVPPPSLEAAQKFFAFFQVDEGHRVLDVGCGTGLHSQLLAHLVGKNGSVTGIDYSDLMVTSAQKRADRSGLSLEYRKGDANGLEFADNSFDRVWSMALLQHLESPSKAVAEMARVAKPGGLVCSLEHDWETLVIDATDHGTAQKITGLHCDSIRAGRVGRQVPRLFRESGLSQVTVTGMPMVMDNLPLLEDCVLGPIGARAVGIGLVTEAELKSLVSDLRQRSAQGNTLWSFLMFRVLGRKP